MVLITAWFLWVAKESGGLVAETYYTLRQRS
jgi:hypothetical protein